METPPFSRTYPAYSLKKFPFRVFLYSNYNFRIPTQCTYTCINTLLHVSALIWSFQTELCRLLKTTFVVSIRHQHQMHTTGTTTLLRISVHMCLASKWGHERFRPELYSAGRIQNALNFPMHSVSISQCHSNTSPPHTGYINVPSSALLTRHA
jgi:hypothetical protein